MQKTRMSNSELSTLASLGWFAVSFQSLPSILPQNFISDTV